MLSPSQHTQCSTMSNRCYTPVAISSYIRVMFDYLALSSYILLYPVISSYIQFYRAVAVAHWSGWFLHYKGGLNESYASPPCTPGPRTCKRVMRHYIA